MKKGTTETVYSSSYVVCNAEALGDTYTKKISVWKEVGTRNSADICIWFVIVCGAACGTVAGICFDCATLRDVGLLGNRRRTHADAENPVQWQRQSRNLVQRISMASGPRLRSRFRGLRKHGLRCVELLCCDSHALHAWMSMADCKAPSHALVLQATAEAVANCWSEATGTGGADACAWADSSKRVVAKAFAGVVAKATAEAANKHCNCKGTRAYALGKASVAQELISKVYVEAKAQACVKANQRADAYAYIKCYGKVISHLTAKVRSTCRCGCCVPCVIALSCHGCCMPCVIAWSDLMLQDPASPTPEPRSVV